MRSTTALRAFLAASLLLAGATAAFAVSTKSWVREGETFRAGEIEGLRVSPDGALVVGEPIVELGRPETSVLWKVLATEAGALAGASEGAGLVHARGEELSAIALGEQPEIFALARGARGALYAATGPEGALYRVDPERGEAEEIGRVDAHFVWDMVVLPDGDLALATGLPGSVQRFDPQSGEFSVLWSTGDPHVRSLALGPEGQLYAGTAGSAHLVEIDPAGGGFVLVDSRRSEAVDVVVDPEGVVYVAFAGSARENGASPSPSDAPPPGARGPVVEVTVRASGESESGEGEGKEGEDAARARRSGLPSGGGILVRVRPGDEPEVLWADGKETPMALALREGGMVLMGTSSPARVWSFVDQEPRGGLFAEFEDARAVSALDAEGRRVVMATSHPASLRALDPDADADALSWISDVLDAGVSSRLGHVHAVTPADDAGAFRVLARAGNTAEPTPGWSPWREVPGAAAAPTGAGAAVELPRARFFQVRVEAAEGASPGARVARVQLFYTPANRAPELRDIVAQAPGIAYRVVPPPAMTGGDLPVVPPLQPEAAAEALGNSAAMSWRSKKAWEPGARTITWEARDRDGDQLLYTVEVCRDLGEPCRDYVTLAEELPREFFSFDSRSLADGVYVFRITASDRLDNAIGAAREASALSGPVVIDNTAPEVIAAELEEASGGKLALRVRARDEGGRLARAEVSTDAGTWRQLAPADGVDDGVEESWEATIEGLLGDEALQVRVVDDAGNVTTRLVAR